MEGDSHLIDRHPHDLLTSSVCIREEVHFILVGGKGLQGVVSQDGAVEPVVSAVKLEVGLRPLDLVVELGNISFREVNDVLNSQRRDQVVLQTELSLVNLQIFGRSHVQAEQSCRLR